MSPDNFVVADQAHHLFLERPVQLHVVVQLDVLFTAERNLHSQKPLLLCCGGRPVQDATASCCSPARSRSSSSARVAGCVRRPKTSANRSTIRGTTSVRLTARPSRRSSEVG